MPNADWYARKLGRQPSTPPPQPGYNPPPGWVPPSQPQQPVQAPSQEEEYRPKGAKHLVRSNLGLCPGCDSPNYLKVTPNTAARCYDCGYPLEQSGSGAGSGDGIDVPTHQARQVNHGTWNPQGFQKGIGIIGRDGSLISE